MYNKLQIYMTKLGDGLVAICPRFRSWAYKSFPLADLVCGIITSTPMKPPLDPIKP